MNDFTKEELSIIHLDMTVYVNRTTILAESPSHKALRDKIESMIDNYCDHKSDVMSSEERERKFKVYREQVLPQYNNDQDKVPPHLEPDFNEGWK